MRSRPVALSLAVLLGAAAIGIGGYALAQPESAAAPSVQQQVNAAAPPTTTSSAPVPPTSTPPTSASPTTPAPEPIGPVDAAKTLAPSQPTAIRIPAINVSSPLLTVGLNPDGSMEVPRGSNWDKAAWYKYSPTPGELGPSVIIGHIDSAARGPSVFYDLDKLQPGDKVAVTREDGTVAIFVIDRVRMFPKNDFPTKLVYGDTNRAELRLITCGGSFNDAINSYRSNIVAFGHFIGTAA